jgi:hypothetical protein
VVGDACDQHVVIPDPLLGFEVTRRLRRVGRALA